MHKFNTFWRDSAYADPKWAFRIPPFPSVRWGHVIAIALGVLLALYASECGRDNTSLGLRPGSAFGAAYAQSLPASYVLATGPITTNDYGGAPEYYEIAGVFLMVKPQTTAETILRDAQRLGATYELVLREVRPRDLEKIQR